MEIKDFLQRQIDRGLTRAEIARKVGVHPSYVTRWMNGMVPDPRMCERIATEFGIESVEVLRMAGHYSGEHSQGTADHDVEWELMQRELREVYDSYDRSHWGDLTSTFKAVASLVRPAQLSSTEDTPQSSRRSGNYAVPEFAA